MNPATDHSTASVWLERVRHALVTVPSNALQLYAGDDRRRMARQQMARQGHVRKAAVLIPIVDATTPHILLTERSRRLRSHPGQISFPGGSVEAQDAGVEAAALRETREEIGLDTATAEILGRLPDYVTGTGFDIAPIVARLPAAARYAPDQHEVVRILTVPLQHVMAATSFRIETMRIDHADYRFHVMEYGDDYIWGATAAMLFGLQQCVRLALDSAD